MKEVLPIGLAIDLILVGVFLFAVFWAAHKGFVLTLLDLAAILIAVFCAVQASGWLAPQVYEMFLSEPVTDAIAAHLPDVQGAVGAAQQAQAVLEGLPSVIVHYADMIGINTAAIAQQVGSLQFDGTSVAQGLADQVAAPIVTALCRTILFLVLCLVFWIVCKLLARLIDQFFKLPVLKTANAALGGVLGAVKGVALVLVLCTLLQLFAGLLAEASPSFAQAASDSRLVAFISAHNPITGMFEG